MGDGVGKGFWVLPVPSREQQVGKQTGMLAGSPSAWVPKMPPGNQKSGVSPANTPAEAHRSSPRSGPTTGAESPL